MSLQIVRFTATRGHTADAEASIETLFAAVEAAAPLGNYRMLNGV